MKLLDFNLPSITRVQWTSEKAKEEWEPKLDNARRVHQKLITETVKHGLRDMAFLRDVDASQVVNITRRAFDDDLLAFPVGVRRHADVRRGRNTKRVPETYSMVITKKPELVDRFIRALERHSDNIIGEMLGYPICCVDHFCLNLQQGYWEPIYQAAENSLDVINKHEGNTIELSGKCYHETSFMLRGAGVNLLPFMPCSFNCEHARKMANDWITLAYMLNLDGIEDLIEILEWPMEWDLYKAQLFVSTPLFKLITNSMPTAEQYVIRKKGLSYPDGAPHGMKFPWVRLPSYVDKYLIDKREDEII